MSVTLAQIAALAALALLMTLGAAAGHRRGPGRQLAAPLAGAVGLLVGWLAGPSVGHACLGAVGVPWIFRGGAGMLAVSLVTWLVALAFLWRAGKPSTTSGEPDRPVLGALVGCWTGALGWLATLAAWGSAEAWRRELADPAEKGAMASSGALAEIAGLPGLAWLAELPAWPESTAQLVGLSRRVMADSAATRRLMADPRVKALASHPTFYPAWGDPEVKFLVQRGRYWALLQHPKVQPVLEDEGFQRELAALDVEAALRRALQGE